MDPLGLRYEVGTNDKGQQVTERPNGKIINESTGDNLGDCDTCNAPVSSYQRELDLERHIKLTGHLGPVKSNPPTPVGKVKDEVVSKEVNNNVQVGCIEKVVNWYNSDPENQSLVFGIMPVIGDGKDIQEALYPYDYTADRWLSLWEWPIVIISAALPGVNGKHLLGGASKIDEVVSGGKSIKYVEGTSKTENTLYDNNEYYKYHTDMISQITNIDTATFEWDIWNFSKVYDNNKLIYENLSVESGIPPELIAALHYRESGADFDTYLHNGQPLGEPTTIVPKNVLYYDFEEAAVHALTTTYNTSIRDEFNLTSDSNDMVAMMGFAEKYNELGYYLNDRVSPYIVEQMYILVENMFLMGTMTLIMLISNRGFIC